MKLDRNLPGGRPKYALIKLRSLDDAEYSKLENCVPDDCVEIDGIAIVIGNESPEDQFFVLKYSDKFAVAALRAYERAIYNEATEVAEHAKNYWDNPKCEEAKAERDEAKSLFEYAAEILQEIARAERVKTKIPD